MLVCVRERVRVGERERERERSVKKGSTFTPFRELTGREREAEKHKIQIAFKSFTPLQSQQGCWDLS